MFSSYRDIHEDNNRRETTHYNYNGKQRFWYSQNRVTAIMMLYKDVLIAADLVNNKDVVETRRIKTMSKRLIGAPEMKNWYRPINILSNDRFMGNINLKMHKMYSDIKETCYESFR